MDIELMENLIGFILETENSVPISGEEGKGRPLISGVESPLRDVAILSPFFSFEG